MQKGCLSVLSTALLFTFVFSITAMAAAAPLMEPATGFKGLVAAMVDNSLIAAILLTVGLAGILIELFFTGFGLIGTVGVGAFILYFLGNIWAGHVTAAVFVLFVVGLLMLIAEIFVTPGMGALGIMGVAAILFSVFWAAPSAGYAVTAILIALILTVALFFVFLKFGKKRNVWNKLILKTKLDTDNGYIAPAAELGKLLGAEGIALTVLRPAGSAQINGQKVDVVTNGEFIEPETPIIVCQVEGLRVVVKVKE